MMYRPELSDFHVHSTFSDGKCDPETMILAALEKGLTRIGFSEHSYTDFDLASCVQADALDTYLATIHALREKYAGRIRVYCGIEEDLYSGMPNRNYDYVIGSTHYIHGNGRYYCTDFHIEDLTACATELFDGDYYALCEAFYRLSSQIVERTGCDVIGHFDLITKLNRRYRLFDTTHPRYRAAWKQAADILLKTGRPFEINTGGVARGHCDEPYPSGEILAYLHENGASFLLSSDSHDPANLAYDFAGQYRRAARLGLRLVSLKTQID